MPKQPKIRWRKGDAETLRREINRYNQRLYYQQKKHGDSTFLPHRESFAQAKASIETRADYNSYIRSLRGFNAKDYKAPVTNEQKLKQVVVNFNKRVADLERATKNADWIPKKVDYNELTKKLQYDSDYKEAIRRYSSLNKKNAVKVVSDTGKEESLWHVQEMEYVESFVNKDRKDLLDKIGNQKVSFGGVEDVAYRAQMGPLKENAVKPIKANFEEKKPNSWDYFVKSYEDAIYSSHYEEKKKIWQQNYIKGLIREGFPQDLIDLLQRIDTDKFAEIIDLDKAAGFDFIYDMNQLADVAEKIRGAWEKYDTGKKQIEIDIDELRKEVDYEKMYGYDGRGNQEHWYSAYMKAKEMKGAK